MPATPAIESDALTKRFGGDVAVAALGLVGVGSVASYCYGAGAFDRYTVS